MNTPSLPNAAELLAALHAPSGFHPIADTNHFVYALWLRGEIIYVGYSRFLEQRINQHRKMKGVKKEFDGYSFLRFGNRADAINAERALIQQMGLSLNVQRPVAHYSGTIEERKIEEMEKHTARQAKKAVIQAKQVRERAEWWAGLSPEKKARILQEQHRSEQVCA